MVRRTVELYECDKCGAEATRYSIVFPDATLILDRCMKHNRKIETLREEQGEWVTNKGAKASFRKSSLADIRVAMASVDGNGSKPT